MNRRHFLQLAAAGSASFSIAGCASLSPGKQTNTTPHTSNFELEELTIPELQAGMASGRFTAASLTQKYFDRIDQLDRRDPALNGIIELNPKALALARDLDRERKAGHLRGPLHGIPVLLKDNIDTADGMMCTAGSLTLLGSCPLQDAFLVRKLRQAGAVILGKTNLSEWANFRGSRSTSGWSGRGGLTRNPYILDHNPSGSSSGSAVAVSANLCAVAIGTETNGSIVSPASFNGIVGIKPTVGLVSRAGIIPIAKSQDTAGPMARTVTDAAILLSCLAGLDSTDPAGNAGLDWPVELLKASAHTLDFTRTLDAKGLRGARLGVVRKSFHSRPEIKRVEEQALEALKAAGATLIDPIEIPSAANSYQVMLYEFKAGLNAYLAGLGPKAPVRSLAEIIAFNERNPEKELTWFGQETFLQAEAKGPLTDSAYLDALAACRRSSRRDGIDAVMEKHQLDALIAPTTGPAHVTDLLYGDRDTGGSSTSAAVAGYPSITVPAGFVSGLPIGLSFWGRAWSEPLLLKFAYAFEQTTKHRLPPRFKLTIA